MLVVIENLDRVNDFWDERVVYNFGKLVVGADKAFVVNYPFITENENNTTLVRYLFVSPAGFGYLNFNLRKPNPRTSHFPVSLYSQLLEFSMDVSRYPMENNNSDDLYVLNVYFRELAHNGLYNDIYKIDTYLSSDGSGQIIIQGREFGSVI